MKKYILVITGVLIFSLNSYSSRVYIESDVVEQALNNAYPSGSPHDWVSAQRCTLCHDNPNGGPGRINGDFGTHYRLAGGTGNGVNVTTMQNFLTRAALTDEDSDGDGFTNLQEFMAGTNPVNDTDRPDNPTVTPPGGNNDSSGSGGCGLVDDSGQSSFVESSAVFGLFFLPLLFTFGFRSRSRKA